MRRLRFRRPTPAMVVALIALFVALGGTGYAALNLPPHSVGKKELKRNAVTTAKIDNGTIRLKDFYRRDLNRLRRALSGDEADDFDDFDDFDEPEEPDEPDEPPADDGPNDSTGAGLVTGAAGGLPGSNDAEYASLTGLSSADDADTAVASLSPGREFDVSDLSVALSSDVGANESVALEIVTRPVAAGSETPVLGCTVTTGRTCTAAGPGTLPANQLVSVRITVTGNNVDVGRAYWGVSVEP